MQFAQIIRLPSWSFAARESIYLRLFDAAIFCQHCSCHFLSQGKVLSALAEALCAHLEAGVAAHARALSNGKKVGSYIRCCALFVSFLLNCSHG